MKRKFRKISVIFFIISINVFAQNNAENYYKSGMVNNQSGYFEEAMEDYNKAIEINPNYFAVPSGLSWSI